MGGLHHVEHVMGTTVSFDIRDESSAELVDALRDAVTWLHRVDSVFSTYRDDSEITRYGRGLLAFDELDDETATVLLRCRELGEVTAGAFDAFSVPAVNGTTVDPSAYVKGWSVERAATILESAGARNFCINGGGDIVVRGAPQPDRAWQIGIRHPVEADRFASVVPLAGRSAIATSAAYERGEHIIDPRTGASARGLVSATVIGADLGTVDAWATALFVMGTGGLAVIERQPELEAYVITNESMTAWTTGWVRSSPPVPSE